ncbi:xanthine dehydrogenase small subunit [Rhodoplanes sp. TEM]|uniref:Xanthine dehydrogenase small subunit n=1 Tax=Rhodoplanes tepidamans TaxID=200616 RepID=A0ABT5JHM3_RHOTP|nr:MULTISPECIES: xanthine dehydrogenase small subunit [Rhodoplanes]MDC7789074.1 xanthine dehydrogenase small subunit [Rhodoplanes tepidamans]MDC7986661.1 xanthine dehydrogenase small subunit [Rhodoplanes sp. TEM]MDQ0354440.1 xanthine dehydrogenase small subunit [Rhodoplanes tepidamans]
MSRDSIQFIRQGRVVSVRGFAPRTTVLDWLRLDERSTGTKEACAEGDCGACTVVLARRRGDRIVYEPINSCIAFLGQIDGAELITVEDLAGSGPDGTGPEQNGVLHPVQAALASGHGSQCGFCTPGIVMSLFAHYHRVSGAPSRQEIADVLAGNLCRCTGYRPIVDAAVASLAAPAADRFARTAPERLAALAALDDGADVFVGDATSFFAAPASEDALAALLEQHPDATIVAGATDVGLWVTKKLAALPKIVHLGRVAGLDAVADTAQTLTLGAAVPLERARPLLGAIDPDIGELMRRFGSTQVRTSGTVGGNIANGSPIGDLAPVLIALGATIELRKGDRVRTLPVERFFLAYGKQDREAGEIVRRLIVPKPSADTRLRVFKITKRMDEDISAVMGAFAITLQGDRIAAARIAFGGMAGVPKRAAAVEAALADAPLADPATWRGAADKIGDDFTPLTDQRGTAAYRLQAAKSIVIKALAEIAGVPDATTRVRPREVARVAS